MNQDELRKAYLKRVQNSVEEAENKVRQLSVELRAAQAVLSNAKKELLELTKTMS